MSLMSETSVAAARYNGGNKAWRVLTATLLLCLLSSCALTAGLRDSRNRGLVANDLATSLTTVIDLGIPLYMEVPQSRRSFSAALQKSLRQQGFFIVGKMSPVALPVSYSIESVVYEKGASEQYVLNVGPLVLTQEYQRDKEGIYPVSALSVENKGVQNIAGVAGKKSALSAQSANLPELSAAASGSTNATTPGSDDPFASIAAADTGATAAVSPVLETAPIVPQLPATLAYVERKNMHETRVSAFHAFTSEYDSLGKQILVFPNDSLRMTNRARATLDALSQQFRQGSDVLSVIGCSHGNTDLVNGNALLAVGRSKRVKRYLADLGIPENRILDEGCWAPVHFDEKMPRRGVVVELKRNRA